MKNVFGNILAFLKKRLKWIIWIAVVIVAVVLVLGACSNKGAKSAYQTAKVERGSMVATVGATGTVRANQSADLVWQTNGTVGDVYVNVGENVDKDEVLATLNDTSMPQSVILARADLVDAERALEAAKESGTARAQAELKLAQAQKAFNDAKDDYDGWNFPRATDERIENTQAQIDLARKRVAMATDAYKRVSRLPDGNVQKADALLNMTNAQLDLNNLVAKYNWYTGHADQFDRAEIEATYNLTKAQLEDAQREWERVKDGPNADDIAAAQARVDAIKATINLGQISSPFAGTVTIADPMPGDLVNAGASGFRVDDLSHLLVDVEISEVDINTVVIGQSVDVTFDAILDTPYAGKVVEVDQVGVVSQGVVNFTVTVELTNADEKVKPGMTAAVTITVNRIDDVLLIPNRAVRIIDDKQVVFVLRDGTPQKIEVRLGASNGTTSVLLDGDSVKEGDEIILNPGPELTGQNTFGPR
jgi:HlyD family secretion protein